MDMDFLKKQQVPVIIAAAVLLILMIVALIGLKGHAPSRKPYVETTPKLQVLAFYEKGWNSLNYGYPSLKKHYKDISVLMPFWYTANADGSISVSKIGLEPKVITLMRKHPEVKLLPLVNMAASGQPMLASADTRQTAINNILKLVADNKFDGVNIDFELLPAATRDNLTVFIRDLAKQLHQQNKMISVSVMPKLDGLEEIGAAYDYGALGALTDFITIMTYDKHNASSASGSVSPYKWVEKNIKEALKYVPAKKLVVCIGAYGYDWTVPSSIADTKYIGLREALQLARKSKAKIQWDDDSQSAHFNYWSGNVKHEVWFENGFSITRKVALAKKYGLRGVAIWRMGFEDQQYWDKIRQAVPK